MFTPKPGPKGVINDWRRFKQLETEQREEQCREMERLIKKLSMTCRSHLDEEEEQQKQKDLQEKISGKVIRSTQAFSSEAALAAGTGVSDSRGVGCLIGPREAVRCRRESSLKHTLWFESQLCH